MLGGRAPSHGCKATVHVLSAHDSRCGMLSTVAQHPCIDLLALSAICMQVEAEAVDEVTVKYEVAMVPYFVLLKVRSSARAPVCMLHLVVVSVVLT